LSNQVYRPPASAGSPLPEDALAVLWGVQPRFLDAALASIEQDLGGLESYLARRMGLSPAARERLASMYLESDPRAGRKTAGV
jgi:protein-tyrosine phosphatase